MLTPFVLAALAAEAGDLVSLDRVLIENPEVIDDRDKDGRTLLAIACVATTGNLALPEKPGTAEQLAAVTHILRAGADADAADELGFAPLHAAAMCGHVELARTLLAAGASRSGRLDGKDGGSPLALALFYAQTEVAVVLAEPAVPDNLRTAACLGRPFGKFVRESGALHPSAGAGRDWYRPSALFPEFDPSDDRQEALDDALAYAARHDQVESMAELVALGADVNGTPYNGTPLLWAIYKDRVAAATWLLDHGADPDLRHDFGGSGHGVRAVAMHLAAQYGSLECLRLLLDRGADPSIRDGAHDGTPLEWARAGEADASAAMLRAHLGRPEGEHEA